MEKEKKEPIVERWPPPSGWRFYLRNWRPLLGILFPAYLSLVLLLELTPVIFSAFGVEGSGLFPSTYDSFVRSLRAYTLLSVLGFLILGLIAVSRVAAAELLLADLHLVRITWDGAWQVSKKVMGQTLLILLFVVLITFAVSLFGILILPMLFIAYCWIKYSLAQIAARAEGLRGMKALNRSWELTDKAFGRAFAAWFVSVMPWVALIAATRFLPLWGRLLGDGAGLFLFPLPSTSLLLLYVELRQKKDGVALFATPGLPGAGASAGTGAGGGLPPGHA